MNPDWQNLLIMEVWYREFGQVPKKFGPSPPCGQRGSPKRPHWNEQGGHYDGMRPLNGHLDGLNDEKIQHVVNYDGGMPLMEIQVMKYDISQNCCPNLWAQYCGSHFYSHVWVPAAISYRKTIYNAADTLSSVIIRTSGFWLVRHHVSYPPHARLG